MKTDIKTEAKIKLLSALFNIVGVIMMLVALVALAFTVVGMPA